jgi:hypothetical protein
MPLRRLKLSLTKHPALQATRVSIRNSKCVYVLIADKRLRYGGGKSRIAYIGTTKNGAARIAQSIASRADAILTLHGVESVHARVITCRPRQHVKTWRQLERALLIVFKKKLGKCHDATVTERK